METKRGVVVNPQRRIEQRDNLPLDALKFVAKIPLLFLPDMFERRGGRPPKRPRTMEVLSFILVSKTRQRQEFVVEMTGSRIHGTVRNGDYVEVTGNFDRRNVLQAGKIQSLRTREIICTGWF